MSWQPSLDVPVAEEEHVMHWSRDGVPSLDQIFDKKDTADYDINVVSISKGIMNVMARYNRIKNNNANTVVMNGRMYGDVKMSTFIGAVLPRIGIMSCVQLLYNQLLAKAPPTQLIQNKVYQYLDLLDIITYKNIKSKTQATGGFVFWSRYNNVLMIVNFGVDILLITKDETGQIAGTQRLSNEYKFGSIEERAGPSYIKIGRSLTMETPQKYHISDDDEIFYTLAMKPKFRYEYIIAERGATKDITKESLMNANKLNEYLQNKTILYGVIMGKNTYIDDIHERAEKITARINSLNRLVAEPERKKLLCIDTIRKSCVYNLTGDEMLIINELNKHNGPPITIYGMTDDKKDTLNNNNVTKLLVMNDIPEKLGMYQSFVLKGDLLPGIDNLKVGQVITFKTPENVLLYFFKIKSTELSNQSIFIQLRQLPIEFKNKKILLSFPDYKKTFKLDVGNFDKDNIYSCDQLTTDPKSQIEQLVKDYSTLTDAHIGLITGTRNLNVINPFADNIATVGNAISELDGISDIKRLMRDTNETAEDIWANLNQINELELHCKSYVTESACKTDETCMWKEPGGPCVKHDKPVQITDKDKEIAKDIIESDNVTEKLNERRWTDTLLSMSKIAAKVTLPVAIALMADYYLNLGMTEKFMKFIGWNTLFGEAVSAASTAASTAARIVSDASTTCPNVTPGSFFGNTSPPVCAVPSSLLWPTCSAGEAFATCAANVTAAAAASATSAAAPAVIGHGVNDVTVGMGLKETGKLLAAKVAETLGKSHPRVVYETLLKNKQSFVALSKFYGKIFNAIANGSTEGFKILGLRSANTPSLLGTAGDVVATSTSNVIAQPYTEFQAKALEFFQQAAGTAGTQLTLDHTFAATIDGTTYEVVVGEVMALANPNAPAELLNVANGFDAALECLRPHLNNMDATAAMCGEQILDAVNNQNERLSGLSAAWNYLSNKSMETILITGVIGTGLLFATGAVTVPTLFMGIASFLSGSTQAAHAQIPRIGIHTLIFTYKTAIENGLAFTATALQNQIVALAPSYTTAAAFARLNGWIP